MAKTWDQVAASPKYQALPEPQKEKFKQRYFSDVVEPTLPSGARDSAWRQFDAYTKKTTAGVRSLMEQGGIEAAPKPSNLPVPLRADLLDTANTSDLRVDAQGRRAIDVRGQQFPVDAGFEAEGAAPAMIARATPQAQPRTTGQPLQDGLGKPTPDTAARAAELAQQKQTDRVQDRGIGFTRTLPTSIDTTALSGGRQPIDDLTQQQAEAHAAQQRQGPIENDPIRAVRQTLGAVPEQAKARAAAMGLMFEDFAAAPARVLESGADIDTSKAMDPRMRAAFVENQKQSAAKRQQVLKATEAWQQALPNTKQWSAAGIASTIMQSAPDTLAALMVGAVGGPGVAGAVMFAAAAPDEYAHRRLMGMKPQEALQAAVVAGSAESIGESLPLGHYLKLLKGANGGKLLRQISGGVINESAGEMLTEGLNIGYQAGVLRDDMPLAVAVDRLLYAGVVGGVMGGGIAGGIGAGRAIADAPAAVGRQMAGNELWRDMRNGAQPPPAAPNAPPPGGGPAAPSVTGLQIDPNASAPAARFWQSAGASPELSNRMATAAEDIAFREGRQPTAQDAVAAVDEVPDAELTQLSSRYRLLREQGGLSEQQAKDLMKQDAGKRLPKSAAGGIKPANDQEAARAAELFSDEVPTDAGTDVGAVAGGRTAGESGDASTSGADTGVGGSSGAVPALAPVPAAGAQAPGPVGNAKPEQPPALSDTAETPPPSGVSADGGTPKLEQWDRDNRTRRSDVLFEGAVEQGGALDALPADLAGREAHGMAKASTATQALRDLAKMLRSGIDPTRGAGRLYTAPLGRSEGSAAAASGTGTASGNSYRDGAFILVAREGADGIRSAQDIDAVLVNPALAESLDEIRAALPGVKVGLYQDAAATIRGGNGARIVGSPEDSTAKTTANRPAAAVAPTAVESDSTPPPKPKKKKQPLPPAKTSAELGERGRKHLIAVIKNSGGLAMKEAPDIAGEKGRNAARLMPGLFTRDGLGIDDIATILREAGYLSAADVEDVDGGSQKARDLIDDAIRKRPVISQRYIDEYARLKMEERSAEEAAEWAEMEEERELLTQYGLDQDSAADILDVDLLERIARVDRDALVAAAIRHDNDDTGLIDWAVAWVNDRAAETVEQERKAAGQRDEPGDYGIDVEGDSSGTQAQGTQAKPDAGRNPRDAAVPQAVLRGAGAGGATPEDPAGDQGDAERDGRRAEVEATSLAPRARKPLPEIRVTRNAVDPETGSRAPVSESADVALRAVDKEINAMRDLLACLG